MAAPGQVASTPRRRCTTCGRFVARGVETCSRCSSLVSLADARARLGIATADAPLLPAVRPSPDQPTIPAIAPALRVVRVGRTRCGNCGRFLSEPGERCEACEVDGAAPNPSLAETLPAWGLPPPPLRTEQLQESWVYQRTRDEYIVPRPSELHPDTAPAEDIAVEADGLTDADDGLVEESSPWRQAVRAFVTQQRIALVVIAGAAAIGGAVALFGSR
jgi:hypothetical protein